MIHSWTTDQPVPPIVDMDHLSWEEVQEYLHADKRCIMIPTGSTEQHGAGPLGTDVFLACAIAREFARRHQVLVAPPIHYGYSHIHSAFPGTISVSPETMEQMAYEIVHGLYTQGINRFIIVNGHGSNSVWLRPLARRVMESLSSIAFLVFEWWNDETVQSLERDLFGSENGLHANCSEFSILAWLYPHHPSPPRIKDSTEWPGVDALTPQQFKSLFPSGVVGANLALVDAEKGEQLFFVAVSALVSVRPTHLFTADVRRYCALR